VYDGDVGEYAGDVGEYVGEVGEYDTPLYAAFALSMAYPTGDHAGDTGDMSASAPVSMFATSSPLDVLSVGSPRSRNPHSSSESSSTAYWLGSYTKSSNADGSFPYPTIGLNAPSASVHIVYGFESGDKSVVSPRPPISAGVSNDMMDGDCADEDGCHTSACAFVVVGTSIASANLDTSRNVRTVPVP